MLDTTNKPTDALKRIKYYNQVMAELMPFASLITEHTDMRCGSVEVQFARWMYTLSNEDLDNLYAQFVEEK